MSLAARSTVRRFVPLVLLGPILGCGIDREPPSSAAQTGIELFVRPSKSLYVEPDMPLGELLARYTQRMGWTLSASEPARAKLAALHCGFDARLEVPFGSVHGFVESLVSANGLLLRFEHLQSPVVLQVIDPADKEQGDIPAHRVLVPLSEVPRWEAHPAHMITTQVLLPDGDTEVLLRNLRAVFGEAARGQVIKTGETNAALLSGTGMEVARLVRVLGEARRGPGNQDALPRALSERTDWIGLLHAPSQGLHLEERPEHGGLRLRELVEQYAQLMGWRLLYGPDTYNQLRTLSCAFALPVDVPAQSVHSFVEGVLSSNQFTLSFAHTQDPILLRVQSTNTAGPGNPRRDAPLVLPSELPRWAGHPAFLVSALLELPGVDVRTLSNTLRSGFDDTQTQRILPLGEHRVLLTGSGSDLATLSTLFHELIDLAGDRPVPPAFAPGRSRLEELLAPPAQPLRIPKIADGVLTLQMFANAYANLMGWRVLAGPDTGNQLKTLHCELALPLEVAPEHVHEFVQSVLRANEFVLRFIHTADPILLGISSTNVAGRNNARGDAPYVPPADLPRWAGHRAFLVTTCLDLPGIDVRTLSNSLRQMFSDQQTQQIIPVGNTNGLIVTGFGSDVADIVKMLRPLSDAAAGSHAPLPEFAARESGIGLLVPPAKGLRLEKPQGRELTLADFFEQYAQLMGWRELAELETRRELKTIDLGLTLPMDVPPDQVHSFAESIARRNDLVLGFAHTREPVLLQISSTNVAGRGNPRRDAVFVSAAELPRWAGHAGFLITTILELPGVDVRSLSNSLRQLFSDQQTQQVIPAGDTNGLVLTGFGDDVAAIATMFGELSRGGADLQVPLMSVLPLADRARLFPLGESGLSLPAPDGKEPRPIEVLEEFASWTKRPLEVSDAARLKLFEVERPFAQPRVVPSALAYLCVGQLLERAHCTLSPVPQDAPQKWVVDVVRREDRGAGLDLPTIPFAELANWNTYCATPFRTLLKLPERADTQQVERIVKLVASGGAGCRAMISGNGVVQLCGTPLEIQVTAEAILRACEPEPDKPR